MKVTLSVAPAFKKAVDTQTGVYDYFNRLLDGCGAGVAEVVPGKDEVEFDIHPQGWPTVQHYLNFDPQFAGQVFQVTTSP